MFLSDSRVQKIKKQSIELKIRSNGHQVFNRLLAKDSVIQEIDYHISKYKLPINITLNESPKSMNLGKSQEQQVDKQSDSPYESSVLLQQIKLFDTQKQINDYLAMQKLLAHDVEQKLTLLSKKLIQILKFKLSENNVEQILSLEEIEETNITKQRLNQIEDNCMKMLGRVQEERKKMDLCVICWDQNSSVIMIPCMHLVLCKYCPVPRVCPVCKNQIQKYSAIYR